MAQQKKRGRPAKNIERIHVSLPKPLMARVRKLARQDRRPVSAQLEIFIERGILAG